MRKRIGFLIITIILGSFSPVRASPPLRPLEEVQVEILQEISNVPQAQGKQPTKEQIDSLVDIPGREIIKKEEYSGSNNYTEEFDSSDFDYDYEEDYSYEDDYEWNEPVAPSKPIQNKPNHNQNNPNLGTNPYDSSNMGPEIVNDFVFDFAPVQQNNYVDDPFDFVVMGKSNNESNNTDYNYSDYGNYDEKEEKEPKMTLHYSMNTDMAYPMYIDTGILMYENKFLASKHVTEFLTQIAIRENGKVIEDENKTMLLLDGGVTIVEEGVTDISDIVISIDGVEVSLLVQQSRVGGRYELAEKLERDKHLPLMINEKMMDLAFDPLIDNSKVLFPIRTIAEELGGEVSWNTNKKEATIKYGDKIITIEGDGDKVMVGDKEMRLSWNTHLDKEQEKLFSIIQVIVVEMDSEMYYENNEGILVIETPSVIEELNNW